MFIHGGTSRKKVSGAGAIVAPGRCKRIRILWIPRGHFTRAKGFRDSRRPVSDALRSVPGKRWRPPSGRRGVGPKRNRRDASSRGVRTRFEFQSSARISRDPRRRVRLRRSDSRGDLDPGTRAIVPEGRAARRSVLRIPAQESAPGADRAPSCPAGSASAASRAAVPEWRRAAGVERSSPGRRLKNAVFQPPVPVQGCAGIFHRLQVVEK